MGNRIHHNRAGFVFLAAAVLVIASCGEYSVYDLLGSQQEGLFALTQTEVVTVTGAQYALAATGGHTEYSFTKLSGPGEVSVDGVYTAPAFITDDDNVAIVTATDRVGSSDSAKITIYDRLTADPLSTTVPMGTVSVELDVDITGGIGEVTVLSNTIEANTAVIHDPVHDPVLFYTPAEPGKDRIELSDEYGSISVVTVTVFNPDVISIDPTSAIVAAGETVEFTVHCSSGDFDIEPVDESDGSISHDAGSDTFTFTASEDLSEAAEVEITVTSSEGLSATATVYIVIGEDPGPLNVSPSNVEMNTEGRVTLTASGGIVPYVFELAAGGGELMEDPDGITAVFTAAEQPGTARVRVYDRTGDFVVAQIRVKKN